MSNFTGFNPDVAKRNINDFGNTASNIIHNLYFEYRIMFAELSQTWASKNAVSFHQKYSEKIKECCTSFMNKILAICENATRAYSIMARANGEPGIDFSWDTTVDLLVHTNFLLDSKFVEANEAGVTGMNVTMIRDFLIPAYESKIMSAVAEVSTIPTSIALYDDENGQQVAFSNNINAMKTEIETMTTELFAELKGYLETEVDTILLAKEKSTDALSGNS